MSSTLMKNIRKCIEIPRGHSLVHYTILIEVLQQKL